MCGINASRGQEHVYMLTMCHASLKMALLLHKVGRVTRLMSTTVLEPKKDPKVAFRRILEAHGVIGLLIGILWLIRILMPIEILGPMRSHEGPK
jgi:hypothetical protein